MKDQFVNLHLHTEYSVQDSVIKIPDLFKTVEQYGQKAVAITDHGSVAGWSDFYITSQKSEIKPIFGCEFYCKDGYEKPSNKNKYHLVALAKNENGIKTINKLVFESTKHFYYKPLLPYPYLYENTDDIFVTTACMLGTIGQSYNPKELHKAPEDAEVFLNKLLDVFGKDNVLLEFQFHPTLKLSNTDILYQNILNEHLLNLYENTDVEKCIVSTDAHFISNPDVRRKLQADAWNKPYADIEPSLKSNCLGTSDLIKSFARESNFSALELVDTMIENTSIVADQCNVDSVNNIGGERILPKFNKHKQFKKIFCKKPQKVI